MSSPMQEQFERSLEEYRRKSEELRDVRRRMAEISVSVTAPRKVITVTVGQQGDVTGVQFPTGAYRSMTPKELAAVVAETISKAQHQAREKVVELMTPVMPEGVPVRDLLAGKGDISSILPDGHSARGLFGGPGTGASA